MQLGSQAFTVAYCLMCGLHTAGPVIRAVLRTHVGYMAKT